MGPFVSWNFNPVIGNDDKVLIHFCIEISFSFPLTSLKSYDSNGPLILCILLFHTNNLQCLNSNTDLFYKDTSTHFGKIEKETNLGSTNLIWPRNVVLQINLITQVHFSCANLHK